MSDATRADRIVLVTGATGNQGGAEVVEGDFEDPDSLRRALDGAYGAYSVCTGT